MLILSISYDSPIQPGAIIFITPTKIAYKTLNSVIAKKMVPPIALLEILCSAIKSSLDLGNSLTNSMAAVCRKVVSRVSLIIPDKSPLIIVSLETSQIDSIIVEIAEDRVRAELLTVVNIA